MPDPTPLSAVAAAYQEVLAGAGTVIDFDVTTLDRLGVPVTSCSLAVDGRFASHGNGYAAIPEAAEVSGLGELCEGVLAGARVAELTSDAVRASRTELLAREGRDRVADPRRLGLPAGSPYTDGTPLRWLPLERLRSGEQVFVPLEFVASETTELGGEPGLITPVTNGLGAGLDAARAQVHGLLEVLQRHTNGLRFRALDFRSPEIARDTLPRSVRDLIERLEDDGLTLVCKHAGTELGVCSTYVMGVDDRPSSPLQVTAAGEAAHPSAEVSLTKAILEYANSRARKTFCFGDLGRARTVAPARYWDALPDVPGGEPRAKAAMLGWRELGTERLRALTAPNRSRTVAYPDIVRGGGAQVSSDPGELLPLLLAGLADHDVLALTARSGDADSAGAVAAKVVVPGLEVEVLSYGRIGELAVRDLLRTDLDLVRVQDVPTETHRDRVQLTAEAEERCGGPVFYSYALADRLVGYLYPLYREPPRHSVVVA